MVFESVVVDLLNRFLGDYVENLDRSQLKLGIWGGDVTLARLDVKESALDDLDLPVSVVSGHLSNLILKIPWKNLYTAPVVATIEGLYVVVVPNLAIKYDAEKEEKAAEEAKTKELQRIEEAKMKEAQKGEKKEQVDTFTEKLVTQIIKNLQVKIKDIHLRYEDPFTDPSQPFAAGITLHNLSFETTDANWKPCIIQETVKMIHKLIVLDSFAVYWNSSCSMLNKMDAEVCKTTMEKTIATSSHKPLDMSYVLGPINASARLILNPKPETDGSNFQIPKVNLNVEMEKLALSINRIQYQDIMKLLQALDRMARASLYRKYRPNVPLKANYMMWWKFAATCILEQDIRRRKKEWSWDNMKQHRQQCRKYKECYKYRILGKRLPKDAQQTIETCEKCLDLFNLTLVRKQAELEVAQMKDKGYDSCWGSWFGGWFGGGAKEEKKQNKITQQFEEAMSPEEKAKLYEAIGYQENAVPMEYPKEFIENKLCFILHNLVINIDDTSDKHIMQIGLQRVSTNIEQRPSDQAMKLVAEVETFMIFGTSYSDGSHPTMATSQTSTQMKEPLLSVLFETNPLDRLCDQRIHICANPLEIVYNAITINQLVEVFRPPQDIALQELQAVALMKLEDIKDTSALGLQHAIELHKKLDLQVDLKSSYVIVPEGGSFANASNCLIINLGNFKMNTIVRDHDVQTVKSLVRAGSTDEEVLTTMIEQVYDKYNIDIQNMEVMLTSPGDDWKQLRTKEISGVHLLNPVSVSVNMQMCIITEDPRLPKMKIHGELPLLNFIFSETKVKQLLHLVQSIPFPKSDPVSSGEEVSAIPSATSVTAAPSSNTNAKALKHINLKSGFTDEVLAVPDEKAKDQEDSTVVQYTDMELKFEIKEIGVDIFRQVENEDVHMLRFAVQKLGTEVYMKTFEMKVDLYLGGIYLHHKEFSRCDGSPLYILGNPYKDSMQNLFTLNYLKAEKKAPDFLTRYQNTLQSVSVSFTNLDMVIHLEAVLSLLNFSNHVTAALTNASQETQSESVEKTEAKTAEQERNISETNVHKRSGRRKYQEVIDIRVEANFESFGIAICTAQHELTSIIISGLHADVTLQKAKTCVSTSLKRILMHDPSENATHSKILSVVGEEFLDVGITIYNFATEDEGYIDMSAVDMSVRISVGRIRFIFMNKFISSLQSFADNFQTAKQKLAEASAAAAEVAKHGMEMAYEKATRILLNICVQAPVVIVPQNSRSTNTIMADLGVIKIHNKFLLDKKRNELGTPALFEGMTIELHDLKLLRAQIESLTGNTVDECLLLEPLTFSLVINRNLAFNWYKEKPEIDVFGKLEAVQMSVSQEDYGTVMRVLSENLAESGYDSNIAPIPSTNAETPQSSVKQEVKEQDAGDTATDIVQLLPENVCQRIRFGFELHSISLSLYEGISSLSQSDAGRKSQKALACLELKKLSVSGKIMNDGSLSAKALLSDCILNDTRPARQSGIKRLMQRIDCSDQSERSMITVNFGKDSNSDTTLNVKVFSFQLILHLGYLMQLGDFFTKAMAVDQNASDGMPAPSVAAGTVPPSQDASKQSPSSRTTIIFQLEQPDLILIEDVEDIDSNIVVLKNAVEMKLLMSPDAMNISGAITNLQVYTAQYNPIHRENSTVQILNPCEITLLYSSPSDKSQHIDISFSTVELHVSPGTVEILSNITSSLFVPGTPEELEQKPVEEDYSKIWESQSLADCSFWFLKTVKPKESAEEITENYTTPSPVASPETLKTEQLLLDIKRIVIIVEAGRGKRTVPMILIESSFCSEVKNWSQLLYIGCSLTTEMGYYNEKMAVWEPIVEPVELPSGHQRPWELLIEVTKNSLLDITAEATENSEEEEELKFLPPEMSISILSNDMMEVTITKTFMEVVSHLSQAFTDAMKSSAVRLDVEEAPYVVKNELGIPVTIKLSQDIFQVIGENSTSDIDAILLESGAKVNMIQKTPDRTKHDDISFLKKQDTHEDIFFSAQIEIEDSTSVRTITVARTDKRLFLLPCRTYPGDQWGFVVDIISRAGSKVITFLSPVEIINYFSIPLEIYYMLPSGNEAERCGFVEPHKKIYLPIQAVYTATRELFFKPAEMDYTVSTHSFVWKDIPEDTESNALLQCSHKQPEGQPFFMEVSRKVNRIFFEDTQKKTMVSVSYTISLRPTVLLNNLLPFSIKYCLQDVNKEYILEPGQHAELWTAEIGRTGIEIKISGYLDCEWVCYKKLEMPANELSVWSFDTSSALEKKLTLDLGMRSVKLKGSLELSIYCPFWMVNKTGMLLTYRTDETNVISHPPSTENPVLFSFKAKTFFAKKKASLKIGDSDWSDKFSLDVVGSQGTVLAKCKNGQTYGVGVQIKLSNAGLTKIVVFTPYYLLINSSKHDIEVQENINNGEWIRVPSNECIPFWPKDAKKTEMIARYAGTLEETIPFSFKQPHTTLLKLSSNKGGLNIDVQVAEASIILKFDDYHSGFASVLLVNHLENLPVVYCQSEKSEKALKSKQAILYTWENPCAKRELTWSVGKKSNRTDLIKDGIGQVQLENKEIIYWVSFLDGMQRVLLFTDDIALATASQQAGELERIEQEILISLQGIGLSLIDNIARVDVMYLGIASSGVIWEAKKLKGSRFKPLSVKECLSIEQAYQRYQMEMKVGKKPKSRWILDGKLEVDFAEEIMHKPQKRSLRRSFQTGLWVQYKTSPHQLQLHAKINKLQIDNQLKDCVFPVVLAPIPLPKSVAADNAPKPFTEASIMIRKAEYTSIKQFKYCKILVQEFHVKLDQGFLNSLISFFSAEEATDIDYVDFLAKDKLVVDTEIKAVAETYSSQELKNFYDILHFSPLKVHISFSMTGSGAQDQGQPTAIHSDFLNLLLQSIGVTLTEVQDIIFRLDYFERQYMFMTQKQLINEASGHYINQTLKQLYMLVLGLDVIGNPVGLLFGLSEGVGDLFYEPFQGAIQGPEEFAEGLALGVKSLFGHAVGGAAGAVSRITGTLGKGLAALTMDEEYQKKRRQDLSRRPADLRQGLARSGKGLLVGVFEGVTGVVTKPLEGAKEEGVEGFFKGVGKGLIGVVARPTSGAIDFASGSLDAVKRATEMSDEVKRLRPPRLIKADAIIRPYSRIEAEGYQLFCDVEKGKFINTDHYLAHCPIGVDGKSYLMVTTNRLMFIVKGDVFGQWSADWHYTWEEIAKTEIVTGKGIKIVLKDAKKKKSFFGSKDLSKMANIQNPQMCEWMEEKIEEAMKRSL